MKKENIETIDEFNELIPKFLKEYNRKYDKTLDYNNSLFLPMSEHEWNGVKIECTVKVLEE